MRRVIGFHGPIGHGKTTAAEILVKDFGYHRVSFADALRDVCWRVYEPLGLPRSALYGSQAEKAAEHEIAGARTSGRRILQLVGTEGFRAATPDVWADLGVQRCGVHFYAVFDDVRFENEAAAIRRAGGLVIHLRRMDRDVEIKHASDEPLRKQNGDVMLVNPGGPTGLAVLRDHLHQIMF